jgi:hypothetical protein
MDTSAYSFTQTEYVESIYATIGSDLIVAGYALIWDFSFTDAYKDYTGLVITDPINENNALSYVQVQTDNTYDFKRYELDLPEDGDCWNGGTWEFDEGFTTFDVTCPRCKLSDTTYGDCGIEIEVSFENMPVWWTITSEDDEWHYFKITDAQPIVSTQLKMTCTIGDDSATVYTTF